MSLRRKLFYAFTLAVIAILLILPSTGWLARKQLLPLLHRPTDVLMLIGKDDSKFSDSDASAQEIQRAVSLAPDDFDIQFANALWGETPERIQRLEVLNRKFPHSPIVIATLLRLMSSEQVKLYVTQDRYWLYGGKRDLGGNLNASKPEHVAHFLALAKEGEQLEPHNAYFTMMAAVGHAVTDNRNEAVAAWVRAGEKSDWEDYTSAEALANWKLYQTAKGSELGSISREYFLYSLDYAHLASIRRMGALIAVKAIQAELAGDTKTGIRLRRANRQNGQRMMLHCGSLSGALVGKGIVSLSAVRPGGMKAKEKLSENLRSSDPRVRERYEAYETYLFTNAQAQEATAFATAVAQADRIAALNVDEQDHTYFGFGKKTDQFMGAFAIDSLLLTGALFAWTFGVIFKLVYRFSPRLQKGEPLQTSARWGVCLGLLLPAITIAVIRGIATDWSNTTEILWAGYAIGGLLVIVPPALLRFSWRQIGHGVLLILATLAALAGIVATGALAWVMMASELKQLGYLAALVGSDYGNTFVIGAIVIAVPLATLGVFGILSRILRIPFAAGVTRGMRATAIPLAAVLMLSWAGTFLYTLHQDHLATVELKRMATIGEAHTIAQILYRPFPN